MNGFKNILVVFVTVASLSFATAEVAPKVKAEGEPAAWNTAVTESLKMSEALETKLHAAVLKLTDNVTPKAAVELLKTENATYKGLVSKVTVAFKAHEKAKTTESAAAVVKEAVATVEAYEKVMEKYNAALKALSTAETTENGNISMLSYLKKLYTGRSSDSALLYAALPLLTTAAFVVV